MKPSVMIPAYFHPLGSHADAMLPDDVQARIGLLQGSLPESLRTFSFPDGNVYTLVAATHAGHMGILESEGHSFVYIRNRYHPILSAEGWAGYMQGYIKLVPNDQVAAVLAFGAEFIRCTCTSTWLNRTVLDEATCTTILGEELQEAPLIYMHSGIFCRTIIIFEE